MTTNLASSTIHVMIVDLITGAILSHHSHPYSTPPVSFVLSENWLVYHFWNQKERYYQLTVLELYESIQPDNRVDRFVYLVY